jgi:hypothetical protein
LIAFAVGATGRTGASVNASTMHATPRPFPASNSFDIAPRQADVIWGISNTFATLPGIFGVYATGWLVDRTGSFAAPFFVTAGVSLVGALVYLTFASGTRQIE